MLSGTTLFVTSPGDAGTGTLRAAMMTADLNPGTTIDFRLQLAPVTIDLKSPLPPVTATTTIDGTSQPGYTGSPLVTVDGAGLAVAPAGGFDFEPGSGGSVIDGLEITGFSIAGITVDNAPNITIGGSTPGQGNVISGNPGVGVALTGAKTSGVIVEGNEIGTDAAGTDSLANGIGVSIAGAVSDIVGGTVAVARNVISGNTTDGVDITSSAPAAAASLNVVEGNLIGTNAAGTAALANGGDGVSIDGNAANNTIGGSLSSELNVISGNLAAGVAISGPGASGNTVAGNRIGTDSSGTVSLADGIGVSIAAATANTIGGSVTGAANVISGNTTDGVDITESPNAAVAALNVVEGNLIGTNAAGTATLANDEDGVSIDGNATNNTIGGSVSSDLNVISGNVAAGVAISGSHASENTVAGNDIGTNAKGTAALANGIGVSIVGAMANTIGGTQSGAGNVISGNATDGVEITGSGSIENAVAGNDIGTNAKGTAALANDGDGVSINGGAVTNTIGGTATAARNVISGNANAGVAISGTGPSGVVVAGNYVGTDASGQSPLGNGIGVLVSGGTSMTIGGTTPGAGNVISGNFTAGIELDGNTVSEIQIQGNLIGTDPTGSVAVARPGQSSDPLQALQIAGVVVIGSQDNTIGGDSLDARNLISGNYVGVMLATIPGQGHPNFVVGDLIGTDISGEKPVGNIVGIYINGAAGNLIGGTGPGYGNVISGNSSVGVEIYGSASAGNLIEGNTIGLAADGRGVFRDSHGLFTQRHGIFIQDASGNMIGGTAGGAGNVISGNESAGVFIQRLSGTSSGNSVDGNYIGLGPAGSAGPGNDGYGIVLFNAPNNPIGRTGPATNHFGRNGIADIRNYAGPARGTQLVTAASRSRHRETTHAQKGFRNR